MKKLDTSDRREQRKFGLLMAAAFGILGGINWWLKGTPSSWIFTVSVVFLIAAVAAPFALRPVFAAWMKFAEALNWIMTRVLLSIVFYGMITPARYLNQTFGSDPLKRAWLPNADTYWEDPEDQPAEPDRYRNQF